jgi:hypothetical protein
MPNNRAGEDAVLKPLIDSNLPRIKYFSLRQWNARYQRLAAKDDNMAARDRFALTGHYTSETTGNENRAALDPNSCRLDFLDSPLIQATCDVDSVIGIIKGDFPVRDEITFKYFMLASPTHTLNSDLHIPPVMLDHYGDREVGS